MNIKEIIDKSGDSELLSYRFEQGLLNFLLSMDELDVDLLITVPTISVSITSGLDLSDKLARLCRLDLVKLDDHLTLENNFYIPPTNFGKIIEGTKRGLNLAYGRNLMEAKWLLRLIGYRNLLICLIANLEDITWQMKD